MKKLLVLTFVAGLGLLSSSALADTAVGVVIGDPTGISARVGLDAEHSFEGALAYSSSDYEGVHVHATYLWDKARVFKTQADPLYMYYGLGLRLIAISKGRYDGDLSVAPRAPLGLRYIFENPNVEVFAELALSLDLTPKTDVDLDGGIGGRIRF